MNIADENPVLVAISIVRVINGTHNVMDLKILKQHCEELVDDKYLANELRKAYTPSKKVRAVQ